MKKSQILKKSQISKKHQILKKSKICKKQSFFLNCKQWKKQILKKSQISKKKSNFGKVKFWKRIKINYFQINSFFPKKKKLKEIDSYKKGEISTKPIGLNGGETLPLLLWFQMKWNNSKGRLEFRALAVLISNEVKWQQGKTEYWWPPSQR